MRKLAICLVLMIAASALAIAQDDNTFDIYVASGNNSAQLNFLKKMAAGSGTAEFYAKALNKLLSDYRNIPVKQTTERKAAEDQAILISARLGAEKYTTAADDLWRTTETFPEPLVKAEALMALGKMGATQYIPQVIRILETINVAPPAKRADTEIAEKIAFGAIRSLEEYKDPSGYLPVFFASTGWYSGRIKTQAEKSLLIIAEDPYSFMMPIVQGTSYDFPTRYSALKNMGASKADDAKKVEVAVAAFAESWKSPTDDLEQIKVLSNTRKLAITMIGTYKTDDESIYPLLEMSYLRGYDAREKLEAISALGALGTEEAAQRLTKFLNDLNTKRRANNIKKEDEQMIRAIIPAIGQAGRTSAIPALTGVSDAGWPPAVKNLADDAMKQLRQ